MSDESQTRGEAANNALEQARQRGRDEAAIEAKFAEHGKEISYLKTSLTTSRREIADLTAKLTDVTQKFLSHLEVGEALNEQVEKNAANQVSRKTYILGLVGAVIALGMLLVAAVALIHGGQ